MSAGWILAEKKLNENSKNYAQGTIRNYLSNLNYMWKNVFGNDVDFNIVKFGNKKPIVGFIKGQHKSRQLNLINSSIAILKSFDKGNLAKDYKKDFAPLLKEINKAIAFRKPSKQQKLKYKSWDEIRTIAKNYKLLYSKTDENTNPREVIRFLVVILFTELPPLRPSEWCDIKYDKVSNDDGVTNFVDLEKRVLVSNTYKTAVVHGKRTIRLNPLIIGVMKTVKNLTNSPWVLPKLTDFSQSMTRNSLSNLLNSIFGIRPSLLRSIFISHLMTKRVPAKRRQKIAEMMGHTTATQTLVYSRFSDLVK